MKIITAENIFTLANIVFTIGTLLLMQKVMKNRNTLKDFDRSGSIITSIALVLMLAGYRELEMFSSIKWMLPTLAFWIFVSVYSIKYKLYQEKLE